MTRLKLPYGGYERWIPSAVLVGAIALGLLHTAAAIGSYYMNADGISYMDMGDAFLRGEWKDAINSIWSPLYSLILGVILYLVEPPIRWEFATVQWVNFAVYLLALAAFEVFWRQLEACAELSAGERESIVPAWLWRSTGYVLFTYASLCLIEIWSVTPDMLMSAWVYLAAAVLIRIRSAGASLKRFSALGALLGLAYLTKSVMFPVSAIFIATAIAVASKRHRVASGAAALAVFAVLAAPYISIISSSTGELTFGDAGKLTYLRYVNGIPYPHWQGLEPGLGQPKHPSRLIHANPPVYEFADPVAGTYPISYDPSFWYRGASPRIDLRTQATVLVSNLTRYAVIFFVDLGGLVFGILLIFLAGRVWTLRWSDALTRWTLIIPSTAALGMYALVLTEGRYIAVFLVLLFGEFLVNARASRLQPRVLTITWVLMAVFLVCQIGIFNANGLLKLSGSPAGIAPGPRSQEWPGETAEALLDAGLLAGDAVGLIGYGFDSYWARLGGLRIVAELPAEEAPAFWQGDGELRSGVLEAFRQTGARAVVAEWVPTGVQMSGWEQVGESSYYVYVF